MGNRWPPLIAKQYFTRFSRITRAINSPPSAFAITKLLEEIFPLVRILAHLPRRRKAGARMTIHLGNSWLANAPSGLIAEGKPVTFDHRSVVRRCGLG